MSSLLSSLASPAWALGTSRQAVRDLAFLPNTFDVEFLRNAIRQRDERILALERELAELRSAAVPAIPAAAAPTFVENTLDSRTLPTSYDVFCTCSSDILSSKQLTLSQFTSDFMAFNYNLPHDLTPYLDLGREAFIAAICLLPRREGAKPFTDPYRRNSKPNRIYDALQLGRTHLGKELIIAVSPAQGGGLEIRRITGPYRFTRGVRCANGNYAYEHQFPTELVRVLTAEESRRVADARRDPQALLWSCVL